MENRQARVRLKPGREKSIQGRHPWVFSGAIEGLEGEASPGDLLKVVSHKGEFLAQGFYNPHSQIALRLLSFRKETLDADFFRQRLQQAIDFRTKMAIPSTALRLVHGDADGLPGLVLDAYGPYLVLQISSLGMNRIKPQLLEILQELLSPEGIIERSESAGLKEEGLESNKAVLRGPAEPRTLIEENGAKFAIDLLGGQKTGFFIDQRDNRQAVAKWTAGKRLLNCFSYTGGFSVLAALAGAQTTSVEISEPAQALARENFKLNGLDPEQHQFITANVFDYLRQLEPSYEMIVLDPPAFVKNKNHLKQACRAYQDINRIAMRQSLPDGLLLTCSCSHYLDWELFQKILFSAATESGRQVQILQRLGQPLDHPVSLFHPEGEYLKAFLLRVI
ncbi:MAG: class I SAM-dependent rRNA methyltransferase [Candidatus Sericytochromatia bacterium]|nr:class I SAM-dependent rRNA methyltransferase [Candidatus Sericytochromatia bacterium]